MTHVLSVSRRQKGHDATWAMVKTAEERIYRNDMGL